MAFDISQCPDCGWTGNESELDVEDTERNCPACGYTLK